MESWNYRLSPSPWWHLVSHAKCALQLLYQNFERYTQLSWTIPPPQNPQTETTAHNLHMVLYTTCLKLVLSIPQAAKGIRGSWAGCQLSFHTATSGLQLLQLDLLQRFCDRCLWLLHLQSPSSLQTTYIFFRIGREGSKQILYMHSADPLYSFLVTYSCLRLSLFYSWRKRSSFLTPCPTLITRLTSLLSISGGRNSSTEFCYSWNPPQILGTMLEERFGEIEKSSEKDNGDDQRTGIYVLWQYKIITNGRNIKMQIEFRH